MPLLLAIACLAFAAPRPTFARSEDADGRDANARDKDEPARAAARAKLNEGTSLYDRGDYQEALRRFREAHDAFPSPKIFFNLGLATRGLGRNAEAIGLFRRFLNEATDAAAPTRAQAQRLLAELRPQVAAVEITADVPGAIVSIDGRSEGETPLSKPLLVDPGPHQIVVEHAGTAGPPFVARISPRAGETAQVRARLLADLRAPATALSPVAGATSPAPPVLLTTQDSSPQRQPGPPIYQRWWFWTAIGAVAAGTTAAYLLTREAPLPTGTLGAHDARNP